MVSSNGTWVDKECDLSLGVYIDGALVFIAGLSCVAALLQVPAHWIAIGAIVLAGMGIVGGVKATGRKTPRNGRNGECIRRFPSSF